MGWQFVPDNPFFNSQSRPTISSVADLKEAERELNEYRDQIIREEKDKEKKGKDKEKTKSNVDWKSLSLLLFATSPILGALMLTCYVKAFLIMQASLQLIK